jgi:hypothetical protein
MKPLLLLFKNKYRISVRARQSVLTGFYQKVLTKKGPLQRRFISTQLHRGTAGSSVLVNYAVWESTEPYKKAFKSAKISELSKHTCQD